jgi:DeoR family transcriptional regulator, catabolite repression regulator
MRLQQEELSVQRPYLLAPRRDATTIASLRHHTHAPPLKINDPAVRAMTDFQREPPLTVTEEMVLEQVLDEMFRSGVRAMLVVRGSLVTGLITAEHAEYSGPQRVVDVMTPAMDVPAVDWQTIEDAQIRDLVEIFEGSGARHLVVLENDGADRSSVRGLIHRARLERQLGNHLRSTIMG